MKSLPPDAIRALAPAKDVTVFDPRRNRPVAYRGVALRRVLDKIYGRKWRRAGRLRFHSASGVDSTIPVADAIVHPAWLAFGFPNGAQFELRIRKPKKTEVDLSPFYLVWDEDPATRARGAAAWPYQIVGIELLDAEKPAAK